MRYDKEILIQRVDDVYTENGNYEETVLYEYKVYGSVVATDIDTLRLVYGEIRQNTLTVHVQNHIDVVFNRMLIDGVPYAVDHKINQRVKQACVISQCPK